MIEEFRYVKFIGLMIIIIELKLIFLIDCGFQKLTVDFFFRLYFIYNVHSPRVNDEDGVFRKGK